VIERIEITNFKAFAHADIRLGSYTLLSGLNSSGKSTVLQALALLRQAGNSSYPKRDHDMPLNGDLVELGTGRDVLHEDYAAEPGIAPVIGFQLSAISAQPYEWHVSYEADADYLRVTEFHPGGPYSSRDEPETADPYTVFHDGFQYLRADRVSPATTYPRSYSAVAGLGFLGTRGEYAIDYLRVHQDDTITSPGLRHEGGSGRLLSETEAWLSEVCPGVRVQASAIEKTDLVQLGFQFVRPGRVVSEPRRPTNVGFGLAYVLPVVVACLTARPGVLIMLENPEAHVHPQGQSAMARLTCAAAAAGAQVIVETHSDHILNGVRLAVKRQVLQAEDVVLNYFRRDDDGIRILSPAMGPDGMLSEWPPGFFDEWDRSLDQLLE
jgi:predicted ATPase